jgi:CHAT domain-containing protein/tetratricopeptide (TPR) repeat protein
MVHRLLGVIAAAAFAMAGAAPVAAATPPREAESFQIGNEGALCEAQGVMLGEARLSLLDRKWALICADVDRPIGTAYSWRGQSDSAAVVGRGRDQALECEAARAVPEAGAGTMLRTCRDAATGLAWNSYAVVRGDWLTVVEGVAAFDDALRLTLASLAANRALPGRLEIVTTGSSGSLAEARAALGTDAIIGQGYRRNNAGDYTQAEEFFRPDLIDAAGAQNPATLAERRHEATVNRALQLSNLGRYDEAARLFAEAGAMGLRDPIQARLLRNFEAIDAVNRGDLAAVAPILARPVPALAEPAATPGAVEIDAPLAGSLNAGLAAGLTDAVSQETRLTGAERAALIDAQARQIGGTTLRLSGQADAALAELSAARAAMVAVKEGRVLSTARLEAQVMAEMALAYEAQGRFAEAGGLLREAVALTELRYPESAALNAANARLAAYLVRRGDRAEAMALYRGIVTDVVGERAALVGLENQLRPYLSMLVEQAPGNPALVDDLFLAMQLVERPGAAQTLTQLSRQLAAGSGEASDLFRRASAIDRELARLNLATAQAQAGPDGAPSALLPELEERRMRLEEAQLALLEALSAYPEYRSVAHNYLTVDELKGTLRPGEGYLKLVNLSGRMFAAFVSPSRAIGWEVPANARRVAELVTTLRDSIALSVGGVTATYPFDVDSARALYDALFAPVAAELAGIDHLVFEPDGALLQLPINLLTADQAGVARYHERVAAGGDEFDFRGIEWLGRGRAISTALSPASFHDARRAPSSRAAKAYLGLGQNEPVGPVGAAARTRGVASSIDPGCELSSAAWNRPIPANELVAATRIFGAGQSDLLTRAAFTDSAVEQKPDLDTFRILHFATHGVVTPPRPGCPAQPALLTSFGGADSDGLLEFSEVFNLDLDADLVILSACDTASAAGLEATRAAGIESGGGQALDGLVRAFVGAGGRQVIASHWPAPEEYDATARLFGAFFQQPAGTSQGDALRAAQLRLMDDPETSHPFYWAGFALIGDGERPLFSGS